eukprot:3640914-Pyramimonas_sp.AAC.1
MVRFSRAVGQWMGREKAIEEQRDLDQVREHIWSSTCADLMQLPYVTSSSNLVDPDSSYQHM